MIEELEMIIPLLDGIKDGAIAAFIVFMGVQYVQAILPYVAWVFVSISAFKMASNIVSIYVGKGSVSELMFRHFTKDGSRILIDGGVMEELKDFLCEHIKEDQYNYIHTQDIKKLKAIYIKYKDDPRP